jgi:hypothetical protein
MIWFAPACLTPGQDLNQGHLDYFFLLLALLMMFNLGLFAVVSSRYVYKEVSHRHTLRRGGPEPVAADDDDGAPGPSSRQQASAPPSASMHFTFVRVHDIGAIISANFLPPKKLDCVAQLF